MYPVTTEIKFKMIPFHNYFAYRLNVYTNIYDQGDYYNH